MMIFKELSEKELKKISGGMSGAFSKNLWNAAKGIFGNRR